MWRRAWQDATRSKNTYAWAMVAAVLGAVLAAFLVPDDADLVERTVRAAVGIFAGFAGGFILCLLWQLMSASRRQRDELRERARELEAELGHRDRVEFSLEGKTETLLDHLRFEVPSTPATIPYSRNVVVWVNVLNHGLPAMFTAYIRNISGLGRQELIDVDEVAWEHTIEPTKEIARGARSRLLVANYARAPRVLDGAVTAPCLWFWASRSAMWAAHGHQISHRFLDFPGHVVNFDLYVVNTTYDQTRRAECQLMFDESNPDAVPTFKLVESVR